jgi:outer membrane lipoprotein-sorting protein
MAQRNQQMKRNRYWAPAGILLAVIALAGVVYMVRASADDLLYQAARLVADSTGGHAIVDFTIETPEKSGSGTVEVWGRWPEKAETEGNGADGHDLAFRIEVLESSLEDAAGIVAVSDGQQVWLWNPAKNTVYVGTRDELKARIAEHRDGYAQEAEGRAPFDYPDRADGDWPESPEEAVDRLLEYFAAERDGTEVIAGIPAHHLRLIPIPEQMPEELRANGGLLNVWLRAADSAPLAIEYADGAVGYGKAVATVLEINAGLDDSLFTFAIPEGASVVNLADLEPQPMSLERATELAAFDVLTPGELPQPARLEEVLEMRGAVVQRYRLPDGRRFTVAQGPAEADPANAAGAGQAARGESETLIVRNTEGALFSSEDGAQALLTWTEGDVTFWIGGDLTPDEVVTIANSLR